MSVRDPDLRPTPPGYLPPIHPSFHHRDDAGKTLREVLPREFTGGEYHDTRAFALKEAKVARYFDGCATAWPGRERNINHFWEIDGGLLVGWNENPNRGWSFPVVRQRRGAG